MSTETYRTALDLAKEHQEWGVYKGFIDLDLEQRVGWMEDLLKPSLSRLLGDEKLCIYFEILMRTIDDVELIHFTEEKGNSRTIVNRLETDEVRLRVRKARASKAMELFEEFLPKGHPSRRGVRNAILTEVAGWWRDTKDEKEADRVFGFLKKAFYHLWVADSRTDLGEIIEKVTGREFPTERLMRHFVCLVPPGVPVSDRRHDEIAGKLIRAWARNSDLEDVTRIFQAVHPLVEYFKDFQPPDAESIFQVLRQRSEMLVALYGKGEELKRDMKLGNYPLSAHLVPVAPELSDSEKKKYNELRKLGFEEVPGDITVGYDHSHLRRIEVMVRVPDPIKWLEKWEHAQGIAWFEMARKHVVRLQKQWLKSEGSEGRLNVGLSLIVEFPDSSSGDESRFKDFIFIQAE